MKNPITIVAQIICLSILIFGTFALLPAEATNGTFEQVIGGTSQTGAQAGFQVDQEGNPRREFLIAFPGYVNGLITFLIAPLFVILAIYAGFLWMTAAGNEEQVNKAKKYLLGATIGMVIIIAARLFVEFILYII